MLRDVDMMGYLSKLFQWWIVSRKKECLCISVLQEGNSKKGSGRRSYGEFVVIQWKSSNTVDGP